jgi:Xaa-Pro aminopeptidase
MFLSDEPGFYKAGDFGIRIENDMEVVLTNRSAHDNIQFLRFDTITLVPYERSLIDTSLLTLAHYKAIEDYHAKVAAILEPLLQGDRAALNALRSRTAKLNSPVETTSTLKSYSEGFTTIYSSVLIILGSFVLLVLR